ncbi:hypothetical protein, partial [Streptomyces lavendulae]|uniref:hypothetical protein n=1 Tax=Streptomyces lavendulae TaxID=1914 RepID=UPI0037F30C6B
FLDTADHTALAEVTALAELFDLGHLLRRVVRSRSPTWVPSGFASRTPARCAGGWLQSSLAGLVN